MGKALITIDKNLYQIIIDDKLDNFKVTQLRDLYSASLGEKKSREVSYQYVYRQINKWKNIKIIEKKGTGKKSYYSKTKYFLDANFIISEEQAYNQGATVNDSISILQSRLSKFESDLLSNIGESEEYKKLYKSLPQLQDYLEPKYLFSMENHLKILGKIKAIKSVIFHMDRS
ncbi:response regulator [Pseudoalteromonas carrageenovora]|uniref:response regulator n=1 Tax=Pseudoalteromonas carrageenovora TaxID=227 RepID=UPI0026E27827|nr:response regulator [Pseudoalteromonas carrageenovora]MDO6649058.1 response regulator [Pseudoalteromonas carrageenovora]